MRAKVVVGILGLVLAACGGGGGGDGGGATGAGEAPTSATAPTGPTGAPEPTAEPEPTEAPAASALVGSWEIGLQDRLDAVLAAYGSSAPGVRCSGSETITFGEDGTFRASLSGRCGFEGITGTARARFVGTYEDLGDAVVLHDVRGRVSAEVAGLELPISSWEEVTKPVPYRIEGGRLVVDFDLPDGVQVSYVYRPA